MLYVFTTAHVTLDTTLDLELSLYRPVSGLYRVSTVKLVDCAAVVARGHSLAIDGRSWASGVVRSCAVFGFRCCISIYVYICRDICILYLMYVYRAARSIMSILYCR
jgi:hypothetical protein